MNKTLIFILIISVFAVSCRDKEKIEIPSDVIPQDKMADILVQQHVADATLNVVNLKKSFSSYTPEAYYNRVLEKNGYTREQFDRSVEFYATVPNIMDKIYDNVLEKLNIMQGGLYESVASIPLNKQIKDTSPVQYLIDFETKTGTNFDTYVNPVVAHTGKQAMLINKHHPYGPAIANKFANSFSSVKVSINFWIHLTDTVGRKMPRIVVSLEEDKVFLEKEEIDFDDQISGSETWNKITKEVNFKYPQDVYETELKFYILNEGRVRMFVDDYDILIKAEQ